MVREQLYINGTEVELLDSLRPSFTYSIADISEPDKRKANFSKTIKLPGSKTINTLFNHIFEINAQSSFNPNTSTPALYLVDSIEVFDGVIQLKDINILDNDDIVYDVVLVGKLANIFDQFGNNKLEDLDLSAYDHVYNEANQVTSWSAAVGVGYVYPMIDYGFDSTLEDFDVKHFFPAVYAKQYLDAMFTAAGFEYDSDFLTGSVFERLIIPYNGGNLSMSESEIDSRLFSADTPQLVSTSSNVVTLDETVDRFDNETIKFTNETNDPSAQHNPSTGLFTAGKAGTYTFDVKVKVSATFTPTPDAAYPGVTTWVAAERGIVRLYLKTPNQQIATENLQIHPNWNDVTITSGGYSTANPATYPDRDYPATIFGAQSGQRTLRTNEPPNEMRLIGTVYLNAGDTVELEADFVRASAMSLAQEQAVVPNGNQVIFLDSATKTIPFDGSIAITLDSTGTFKNRVADTTLSIGDTLEMSTVIPVNVLQRDFFMSIVKMFNLYIESDPDNPKKLKIEPRNDFYNSTVNDWSEKLDISQEIVYTPMGALTGSEFLFTYKQDKDYYNKKYQDSWSDDIYGERQVRITNDFNKSIKKTDVIFSPTPCVGQNYTDRVIPTIIAVDSNLQAKRVESNIRILYWGGLKATTTAWHHSIDGTVQTTRTNYPYAGHYDDPYSPTLDINFGLTREIYWDETFGAITITDNNLYNAYHKLGVEEITDPDSKVARAWFNLTPMDVKKLSFRELYYFDGAYFRLHKVKSYNPTEVKLTECEFLKLKAGVSFTASTESWNGASGQTFSGEYKPSRTKDITPDRNVYNHRSQSVSGDNNHVADSASKVKIQGDNNVVGNYAKNITIIGGDDNVVDAYLENVTLINTSDLTVTESDVTYINGVKAEEATDYHSGFKTIDVDETYTIQVNKQMANFTLLDNEGTLNIEGDLILE